MRLSLAIGGHLGGVPPLDRADVLIAKDDVRIRRATRDDVSFMLEVVTHEDVQPFLGARAAFDEARLAAELDRQGREPEAFGRFVIEVRDGEEWRRAGTMGFERVSSELNRIAHLERLAVHPSFRGRRIADRAALLFQRHLVRDLGYHRLEMEVYGFNERALAHAERIGWVREGVKRQAYLRLDEWVDGVMFGIIEDDLKED
jgi:RimJ/RimL family protein N-acetyltransferase